jgi:hypothetical protein
MKAGSKYWDALDPFFERIFILGGARGTQKKLQDSGSGQFQQKRKKKQ